MSRRSIGGRLDTDAYGALAGRAEADRSRHFQTLDPEQQAAAVRRLATTGMSLYDIANATGLSAEFIRRLLSEEAT